MDLAAGELPEARHALALGAPRQQNPAINIDQSHGGDENDGKSLSFPVRSLQACGL
jgi:hypothetical protein